MKKTLTAWFVVVFAVMMVCFTLGYCDDDAPQAAGDTGVTDAVTPRFVKPGKIDTQKRNEFEPLKVEESTKTTEVPVAVPLKSKTRASASGSFSRS